MYIIILFIIITIASLLLISGKTSRQLPNTLFPIIVHDQSKKSHTIAINLTYCNTIINNDPNTDPHFLNLTISTSSFNERHLKLRHEWPPYLISFGGSGNSYIRLIIEDITNIYTGAIYKEPVYEQLGFAGKACDDKVIVVKAHPFHIMLHKDEFLNGKCVCACDKTIHRKLHIGKQINAYELQLLNQHHPIPTVLPWMNVSAIFLIRDPWKAAFSAMQMAHGEQLDTAYDGGEFDQNDIFKNIHTRHLPKQLDHHKYQISGTLALYITKEWVETFDLIRLFKQYNLEHIVIKLESFVSADENIALHEWDTLFGFLLETKWFDRSYMELRRRMKCAHAIGDAHDRMRLIHRQKKNVSDDGMVEYWNIEAVYDLLSTKRLCIVWKEIKDIAEQYGYKKWKSGRHHNADCMSLTV